MNQFVGFLHRLAFPVFSTRFFDRFFTCNTQILRRTFIVSYKKNSVSVSHSLPSVLHSESDLSPLEWNNDIVNNPMLESPSFEMAPSPLRH
jgi:hypothetical protein